MIFVVAVPAVALFLWARSPNTTFAFDSFPSSTLILGKAFGILGIMLFALNLILSARFKFLEDLFYGLNRVYIRHSQIGQIAFILMLFHPLLLLPTYTDLSFSRMISFFTPSAYTWPYNWGMLSLYLLIILIALTLYLRPKYHIWKWTHKFMGLAFFFAGLHAYLIPSDTATFLPLRVYVVGVSAVALYAYIYHTIFGKYTTKKYKYLVSGVRSMGENITEITLAPENKDKEIVSFTPGQFVFVNLFDKNISAESHPFSISHAGNNDGLISFTIKNLGDYTKDIGKVSVGAKALIEGPFGKFSYNEAKSKKQIWIAGGIGITPFLSMAKSVKKEDGFSIDLYYCVRDEKEAVYLNELLATSPSGVRVIPHYSTKDGFINANIVEKNSGGVSGKSIFICSPVSMIQSLRRQFVRMGIPNTSIYSEEFSL